MSRQEAMKQKEKLIRELQVTMQVTFDTKNEYIAKLHELLETESTIERLNTEVIAEKDVAFVFKEIHEICCRISMKVPKTNQQYIREHAILSVVIPLVVEEGKLSREYLGAGTIKKVTMLPNDKFLSVDLQIDIVDPLDRKKRQPIPLKRLLQ